MQPSPVSPSALRRVLIASANPLFRAGLHKVYPARWGGQAEVVAMTTSMQETLEALETHQPDLVIIDHDDRDMNRTEFLNRFVIGESPMQVVLVSLGAAEVVVVYDRRQLTAAEAEAWLSNPWSGTETPVHRGE